MAATQLLPSPPLPPSIPPPPFPKITSIPPSWTASQRPNAANLLPCRLHRSHRLHRLSVRYKPSVKARPTMSCQNQTALQRLRWLALRERLLPVDVILAVQWALGAEGLGRHNHPRRAGWRVRGGFQCLVTVVRVGIGAANGGGDRGRCWARAYYQ